MDKLTLINLLTVCLPEFIIVFIIGILAIGKLKTLKIRSTQIRILASSILATISVYFIRPRVGTEIEVFIITLFINCLLLIFIVKLKFYESILAVIFGYIIFTVLQTISIMTVVSLSGISLDNARKSDIMRFIIVLPERILEIILIYYSIRKRLKIIDFDNTNIKRKEYYIQLIVYIFSIGALIILSYIMAKTIFLSDNITSSANAILLKVNIYLTLFVTIILTIAIKNLSEHYKTKSALTNNEILQNLEYVSGLLNENKCNEAEKFVRSLKERIIENNI